MRFKQDDRRHWRVVSRRVPYAYFYFWLNFLGTMGSEPWGQKTEHNKDFVSRCRHASSVRRQLMVGVRNAGLTLVWSLMYQEPRVTLSFHVEVTRAWLAGCRNPVSLLGFISVWPGSDEGTSHCCGRGRVYVGGKRRDCWARRFVDFYTHCWSLSDSRYS